MPLMAGGPTPAAPTIDNGDTITLTANPSSGTLPYTYQWYSGSSAALCTALGSPIGGATAATYAASPTTNTYFCYTVTDATPTTLTSTADLVTVNSALTNPAAPTVSATAIDVNQAVTVSGTIPSTGTSPYSWQWLVLISTPITTASLSVNAGDVVVALAGYQPTTSSVTFSDSEGDTFSLVNTAADSGATVAEQMSTATVASTSSTYTVTAAFAGNPARTTLDVLVYRASSGTLSIGTNAIATATSAAPSVSVTANSASDFVVAGFSWRGGATDLTTGLTGNDRVEHPSAGGGSQVAASGFDNTGGGSVTNTESISASSAWVAVGVDVKATALPTFITSGTANGGTGPNPTFATATQCAVNSGSGATGGATETCSIAANTLTVGATYTFELQVTDSAFAPSQTTSNPSPTIIVNSALTAPAAPTVSATKLDVNQLLTVTGDIPVTGTSTYTWQWLTSVNGGGYASSTQCAVNSGSGASRGATKTCSIAANTLTVGNTYAFELQVSDTATTPETATSVASSTVTVSAALVAAAVTPGSPTYDVGQTATLTSHPSLGTTPYSYQWYSSATGTGACNAGTLISGATSSTYVAPTGSAGTTYYCYQVTDSATTPTSAGSAWDLVTVNAALVASGVTPSLPKYDVGQTAT
ncbi:MAG: hypothetical protein L3K14_08400, partial [Thermoplasmata archaeon]|nr:hypothetical protein [Thermoplasmata archaeon]